jgi:hypothetical protein
MNTKKWSGPIGKLWTPTEIAADGGPRHSKLYKLVASEELEAVKLGARTRITDRSYQHFKQNMPRITTPPRAPFRGARARAFNAGLIDEKGNPSTSA